MGVVSVFTFTSTTETVTKTKLNNLNANLVTEFNGSIDNSNIKAAAGIVGSKLDLSTPGIIGGSTPAAITGTTITATTFTGTNYTGGGIVPSGGIIMWSGAVSAIPAGWVICDGDNSTPDLTGRFVIHASADSGDTYDVDDTGGSMTHSHADTLAAPAHTHTGASHTHTVSGSCTLAGARQPNTTATGTSGNLTAGNAPIANTISITSGGTTPGAGGAASATALTGAVTDGSTVPAYYALAYIMKT